MRKMIFDPFCIFLIIDFCENLQEYFFVGNNFLIIKIIKKNSRILNRFYILAPCNGVNEGFSVNKFKIERFLLICYP